MKTFTFAWLAAAALLGAACTDEEIVYVPREPFNPPADTASGFLGYFTVSDKTTSCGNCHVDHQNDWVTTAHAGAWSTLQGAGGGASCAGCHSVSEKGNALEGAVGYDLVPDTSYHDVQCESCHGPGFDHASVPDVGSPPLARLRVTDTTDVASCAECHSGSHHPFVEEWDQSRHSNIRPSQASNPSCVNCHEARAALRAWGQGANYVERDSTGASSYFPPTTCGLCHDPHGSENSAQLRFPIDVANEDENLCVKCHMRRIEPVPGSSTSPHAPQGGIFYGTGGYRNPTYFVYDTMQVATTHASGTANVRQCAGCHVVAFTLLDTITNTQVTTTGHTFRPIPCIVNGRPVAANNCAYTTAERSWKACAAGGCHASEAVAQAAFTSGRNTLKQLVDVVWVDVDGDKSIDPYPTDTGYLAKVKLNAPTQFNSSDSVITAAEGAEFNTKTVGENLYSNGDKSFGVHNAFLSRALIQANIQEMLVVYSGFLPAPPPPIQALLAQPLPGTTRTNAVRWLAHSADRGVR